MPGICPGIFGGERNCGSGAGEAKGRGAGTIFSIGATAGLAGWAGTCGFGGGAAFIAAETFADLLDTLPNYSLPAAAGTRIGAA